ncbi:MAG: M48 family metalloprotease [Desertifilum sp.]|nr:M48 family metalloprotease [Desertifilum sp.]
MRLWKFLAIACSVPLSGLWFPALVLAEPTPVPETLTLPSEVESPPVEESPETEDLPLEDPSDTVADPEKDERFQAFAEADRLYREGQIAEAQKLYRQLKEPFSQEILAELENRPIAIVDVDQLSPAGRVYWREVQAGLEQNLETRIMVPLQLLVEQYPEFIPGHLKYAEVLTRYNRTSEALKVLERATRRYPDRVDLLNAKIEAQAKAEEWLDASLAARQFALLYPEHPEAKEFSAIADTHLRRFQSSLRSQLRGNAIANVLTGIAGYALTGNIFAPLSAVETTVLLLRGESAVGDSITHQLRRELPLVEDEEILAYVNEIGEKLIQQTGRDFNYEFHIILDDRLNAFALPGGKIFINAGAILKTNSEAELAGLLAHELAHTVLSHGFQLATSGGLIGNIAQYLPYGGLASNLLVFSYSREMERQADELGTRILAASGYAADGMHNLMLTLAREDTPSPPAWLSTHPDTQERIRNLERQILQSGLNRYAYEGVERHAEIQERLKPLVEAENERQERRRRRR